jgi:proton-translocating NADH-quinone oxidoreductase, chain N
VSHVPEVLALAPAAVLGVAGLLVTTLATVAPRRLRDGVYAGIATLASLVALGVTVFYVASGTGVAFDSAVGDTSTGIALFGGQVLVDGMALLFTVVFTSVTALVSVASYDYMRGREDRSLYYSLVLLAATGMTLMAAANGLAVGFIALELSSLPSYALVAILKQNRGSVEAGLKYFLVGALSSAVLVYGISLVYGATGSLLLTETYASEGLPTIAGAVGDGATPAPVLGLGVVMVLGGLAFKTATVPFHFWAPEAYEGAPGPVSAFLSSASKAAGFALLLRVFVTGFPATESVAMGVDWVLVVAVLAVVTMTLGNLAAATQETVKRMLAYSSVGHAGYVLIGVAAYVTAGDQGLALGASVIHLVVYGFMNTGAFLFVALVEYWDVGGRFEEGTFEEYNGLATQAPVACAAMTVCLLSLAGVPPGGGFASKLFLFAGAVDGGLWWLAVVGVLNSTLSVYYYLRVVKAMWIEEPATDRVLPSRPLGLYVAIVAAGVLTVLALPAIGLVAGPATESATDLIPATLEAAATLVP